MGALRLVLAALAGMAVAAGASSAIARDAERMDQVARASAQREEFSGAALVARGDQMLLDRGYGLANREWDQANDGDTRFRLGSLTKQFTAVAILVLAERGALDVDAPVRTYLPDAPPAWDGITLHHLLTHTSGLADFTRLDDYDDLKVRPSRPSDVIARLRDRPLEFAPGRNWAYSNSGYVVLTAVIEAVSGEPYAQFVRDALFQPLGMTESGYDDPAEILPRRAAGYVRSGEGGANAGYVDMSLPQGAGGLYSTTHDLLKWERGLFGGRLLNARSMARLTTPDRNGYALGLQVSGQGDDRVFSHSGAIDGFNSYMAYVPSDGVAVIVLGNLSGPGPEKVGGDLLTLARGGVVTLADERRAVVLSGEMLDDYPGVYALSPAFALTLSVVDGALVAQATGQQPLALSAEAPDAFFAPSIDAQIVFTRDDAGAVDGLVLRQGGREMTARRQPQGS